LFVDVIEFYFMGKPLVYDLSLPELKSLLVQWNEPPYRGEQIWKGIYQNFWKDPKDFSVLPLGLRNKLSVFFEFTPLRPIVALRSKDGETSKTLFRLQDGKAIETVLMKYEPSASSPVGHSQGSRKKRHTLCISTQVGCAMGCVFCATGQMGFQRHLTSGEIIAQVMYFVHQLFLQREEITNIVVMGMGEPFHNYDNTMSAIDQLNDSEGFNFGARRFTISTVGLIPVIRQFTCEKRQVNLAISLHAATNDLRTTMLPVNKRYPLDELLEACRDYTVATGRRITLEWALVNGINDTVDQANILSTKLKGMLVHVNAIPLNPTSGFDGKVSTNKKAKEFKDTLVMSGIPCTIRVKRGNDIKAGCGQLYVK